MLDYDYAEFSEIVDIEKLAAFLKRCKKVEIYFNYVNEPKAFRQIFKAFYKLSKDVDDAIVFTKKE